MLRICLLSCTLCLLTLLAPPSAAQNFVIGVEQTDYFPVYAYRKGQYQGFARDLLDAFAKQKGYQFSYTALPIKRLFATFLGEDSLDFKFPDSPEWQPDLKKGIEIQYSTPLFESTEGGLVLAEQVGRPLSALKTLGTIRGFTPWPYQDALSAGVLKLEESDDINSLVQKALVKRLDVVFLNQAIADYFVREELGKPGALVLDPGLPSNPVAYRLASRRHPQVIAEFDAFMRQEQALIEQLLVKHKLK